MLTKMVNGVSVECSPEEEAAFLAEWEANDPAKRLPQEKPEGVTVAPDLH